MSDPVSTLISDIASGTGIGGEVYAPDVAFDATVPNWRFQLSGADAVRDKLSSWYADPGEFSSLDRLPVPDGELVTFTLHWSEDGVDHTSHQAHLLAVTGDRISAHTVWCGGRWPADLVAEMAGA